MEPRADIHRRSQLLYWLRIACLVGLCGIGSCQDTERQIVSYESSMIRTQFD
jgi:hypothetical protein